MTPDERSAVVDEIVAALETRGAPAGTWMVDIARARDALHNTDSLLLRMQAALVRDAERSSESSQDA